jgi:hypothetical protein
MKAALVVLVVAGAVVAAYALLVKLLVLSNPRRFPVWFLRPVFKYWGLKSVLKELCAGKTMAEIVERTAAMSRAMQERTAESKLPSPSTESPTPADSSRPLDEALVDLANNILRESGLGGDSKDINDAAVIVLTHIGTSVLCAAGDTPVPPAAHSARPATGVCFIAACLIPITVRLRSRGVAFDPKQALGIAAVSVFQGYGIDDRAQILFRGSTMFQEVLAAAADRANIKEWLDATMLASECYVLTADKKWLPLLRRMYETLVAAEEVPAGRP